MAHNMIKAMLLATSSALLLGAPAGFAEDAADFTQFSTAAETSAFRVNYTPIKQFTTAFGAEQRGRMKISYAAVDQQGEAFMKTYMGYLSSVPVSTLARNDQMAFWLNTHNMLVMDAMSHSKSRRRMSSERGTPSAPGAMWTEKLITVEGVELSLHDIEQSIILANFSDTPNVIFGLYQGTSGGPAFHESGFSGSTVVAELEGLGRDYVNSRSGVKVRGQKAQLPAVYAWYSDDLFSGDDGAARAHFASLLDEGNAKKFAGATQFETRKFSYSSDELIIRQQQNLATSGGGGFARGGGGGGGGS